MFQLIVFEGIDGSGTTTQSRLLANALAGFWDKEPTDGEIGIMIREILKNKTEVHPITLLQLFLADRVYHQKIIKQKQEQNIPVVLDRYILSTLAYQGIYFAIEDLFQLNKNFMPPNIIFYIDIDIDEGLKRKEGGKDLFENREMLLKIRENYKKAIDFLQKKQWNIICLDGKKSIEELHQEILSYFKKEGAHYVRQ